MVLWFLIFVWIAFYEIIELSSVMVVFWCWIVFGRELYGELLIKECGNFSCLR